MEFKALLSLRLISILFLIPIIIAVLFLLSPTGFTIIILIICILAAWEWGQLSGFISYFERTCLAGLFGILLMIMILLLPNYCNNMHKSFVVIGTLWTSLTWWIIAFLLVLFYPCSAKIWKNSKILRLAFGLLTIIPFLEEMLILRVWHYNINHYDGAIWLLYIMVLVWGADSGAYVSGKLFGKHKIAPKISPNKTWQGFMGGIVTSAIISWSYNVWINLNITSLTLIICSVIAILASVLGDLTESMFKREACVKDSGNFIPGHGGILDRIDSLTAAIPVFICLLLLVFRAI